MCGEDIFFIIKGYLCITINQLLLATIVFRDLSEINWFATTNFCDLDVHVDYQKDDMPDII